MMYFVSRCFVYYVHLLSSEAAADFYNSASLGIYLHHYMMPPSPSFPHPTCSFNMGKHGKLNRKKDSI